VTTGDWIIDGGQMCTLSQTFAKTTGNIYIKNSGSGLNIVSGGWLKMPTTSKIIVDKGSGVSGTKLIVRSGGKFCGGTSCG
jgi:hypothetical protein